MMDISSLMGWGAWLGFAAEYVLAGLLIAVGVYLAAFFTLSATNPLAWLLSPLRIVGYALIGLGLILGAVTYGKTLGATECNTLWREKNLEGQIDRLKQQLDAKTVAADAAQESLKQIASEKEKSDATVADYQSAVAQLEESVAACRRATADDDRRMCKILGPAAPGCGNP